MSNFVKAGSVDFHIPLVGRCQEPLRKKCHLLIVITHCYYHDLVAIDDGVESMRHSDHGAIGKLRTDHLLYSLVRFMINIRSGFIQDH